MAPLVGLEQGGRVVWPHNAEGPVVADSEPGEDSAVNSEEYMRWKRCFRVLSFFRLLTRR